MLLIVGQGPGKIGPNLGHTIEAPSLQQRGTKSNYEIHYSLGWAHCAHAAASQPQQLLAFGVEHLPGGTYPSGRRDLPKSSCLKLLWREKLWSQSEGSSDARTHKLRFNSVSIKAKLKSGTRFSATPFGRSCLNSFIVSSRRAGSRFNLIRRVESF